MRGLTDIQTNNMPVVTGRSLVLYALVFFSFLGISIAQTNQDTFAEANELYRNNEFAKAITLYEKIEKSGQVSPELYFNLGNAHYKLNNVAPSIYNYEKALQIDPDNEDVQTNLIFAKRMTIDVIEDLPLTFFQKLEITYVHALTYDQWALLSVVFSFLMALSFLLYYFSYVPTKKRMYFVISGMSLLLLVLALTFSFKQYNTSFTKIEAIVFSEKVSVMNAPSETSQEVFELHEGVKIAILDSVDVWKKIKLADGKTGWIEKSHLKQL